MARHGGARWPDKDRPPPLGPVVSYLRSEYGLRVDSGGDAGDVIPIDDLRAERMLRRQVTINGNPATLMVRMVSADEWGEVNPPTHQQLAEGREIPVVRYRRALTYIASPTMGLPSGRDALDFVDEASEVNVREALKACIRTARWELDE